MAPRATRGEETEADDAATGIALVLPTEKTVKELARLKASVTTRSSAIAGEFGSAIANAVEKKHVNRKALMAALKFHHMPDEELAVVLPHFMHVLELLKIPERASAQNELFGRGPSENEGEVESEDDEDADGKKKKRRNGGRQRAAKEAGSNVTPIGDAARAVVEEAGEASRH